MVKSILQSQPKCTFVSRIAASADGRLYRGSAAVAYLAQWRAGRGWTKTEPAPGPAPERPMREARGCTQPDGGGGCILPSLGFSSSADDDNGRMRWSARFLFRESGLVQDPGNWSVVQLRRMCMAEESRSTLK